MGLLETEIYRFKKEVGGRVEGREMERKGLSV